jgi:hypothetical protein
MLSQFFDVARGISMQSLISRITVTRIFLFLFCLSALTLLSSCDQLPLLSNPNVPARARWGQVVPVSVDLDPKNFPSRDVVFRYGLQNGGPGQWQALNCNPVQQGSSVLRCSGNIRFDRTGDYEYDFLYTYQLNNNDVLLMVPQPVSLINIFNPAAAPPDQPGGITSGSNTGVFDPAAVVVQNDPLTGDNCVGDPPANKPNVQFNWQAVPGVRHENGAYQVEIHRIGANCQPVNWTGVGQTDGVYGSCWIADTNTNFHAENLEQNTEYQWRVRGTVNNGGAFTSTAFSPFQRFTTGGPETSEVQFVDPVDGQIVSLGADGSSLTVEWADTSCQQVGGRLQVFEDNSPIGTIDGLGTQTSAQIGVSAGKTIRLVLTLQTRFGQVPVSEITFQTVR